MTVPHRRIFLLALGIAAIVLSGCEVRQNVEFNEDGSGTFTYLVGIEKDILDDLGVDDPYEGVKQQVDDENFPVELDRYETSDLRGFRLSFEFTSLDDLKKKLSGGEEGQEGQQTIQEMKLERGDDLWDLTGAVGSPNLGSGNDMPIDVSELEERLEMEFSIVMPGALKDSNADSVRENGDSTTFVWALAPGQSGREISAVTDVGSGSFPVLLVVGAGLSALVIGAALWLLIRRRLAPVPVHQAEPETSA